MVILQCFKRAKGKKGKRSFSAQSVLNVRLGGKKSLAWGQKDTTSQGSFSADMRGFGVNGLNFFLTLTKGGHCPAQSSFVFQLRLPWISTLTTWLWRHHLQLLMFSYYARVKNCSKYKAIRSAQKQEILVFLVGCYSEIFPPWPAVRWTCCRACGTSGHPCVNH